MSGIRQFASEMRKEPTQAEAKFWSLLRNNQTGYKFRRQNPIHNKYIADFMCRDLMLIIEIDGSQHCDSVSDQERTVYLEKYGFTVLRFWNVNVINNLEGCYQRLMDHIKLLASIKEIQV